MKRASATVVESPCASSVSAASSAAASRVPSDRIATLVPSRMIRPRPISRGTPRSGISQPTPSPRGKRKAEGRSSIATEVATMWTSSASSAGAMITKFGRQPRKARSNDPAWVAPSAPTKPARSIGKRTGSFCSATSCATWSKPRCRKVE